MRQNVAAATCECNAGVALRRRSGFDSVLHGTLVRTSLSVNGLTTTTLYVVDDRNPTGYAHVLEELTFTTGTPAVTRAYVYGHDLIAQDQIRDFSWTLSFYGYDGHGSVRLLTDIQGQVSDTYDYDAFGNQVAQNVRNPDTSELVPVSADNAAWITVNLYLYTGEQFDPDLGFYYLRARYHHPDTGRFWTMDSYEGDNNEPSSFHKYLYCTANPINSVDPSGFTAYMLWIGYTYGVDDVGSWGYYLPRAMNASPRNVFISIRPGDNVYAKVHSRLDRLNLVVGKDTIETINISGHGGPADLGNVNVVGKNAAFTLESLDTPDITPQRQLLVYLRPFTRGNCTVYLRACSQAKGDRAKKMMELMAKTLVANVVGWDDWYGPTGHGNKWTVDPSGKWTWEIGLPWEGSITEYFWNGHYKPLIQDLMKSLPGSIDLYGAF